MILTKQAVLDALEKEREYLVKRGQYGAENVLAHHAIRVVEEMEGADYCIVCPRCGRKVTE